MKRFLSFLLLIAPLHAFTYTPPQADTSQIQEVQLCDSYDVFLKTVEYLKNQTELPFSEPLILRAALDINKGCNGAEKRFSRVFELLFKSGVDMRNSYELALTFSKMNDEKTDNFVVLFKGLFLENKFDFDFMTAYKTSLKLSAALPDDWLKIQRDFKSFVDFCSGAKSEDLPIRYCGQWTLRLLSLESFYPAGVYESFASLNQFLSNKSGLQMPVKDRMKLISKILTYGPKAPSNFQKSLEWLSSAKGAGLPAKKAHKLALEIAQNSLKTSEPLMTLEAVEKQ